uniref:Uncharacterized protein n=1 Tax=Acrobeloides nanus TaxID=290746 RepID=A0A914CKC4_9BILA
MTGNRRHNCIQYFYTRTLFYKCSVLRKDNKLIFGFTSTSHPQYTPVKRFVIHGLFDALSRGLEFIGPHFLSLLVNHFKPKLMAEKIGNHRKAIVKFDI